MERRFGDSAVIEYLDASREDVRTDSADLVEHILNEGLAYPVTVVDGEPLYDGAVSYPAIMRAVESRLAERQQA